MKTYNVEIENISPLLMHGSQALGMDDESKAVKKKGGSALLGDENEWKRTIYFDKGVGCYLPAGNIEAALVEASKQFKITGRATATKFFKSGVFITEDILPILVDGKPILSLDKVEVDKRCVKNPSTGGRQLRYRAIFKKWRCSFSLMVSSDDYISGDLVKQVLDYAGMYVGLCDYRPRFGRFQVVKLKERV